MPSGTGMARLAESLTFSAKAPQLHRPSTLSPGRRCVTLLPTADTIPDISPPGEKGSSGLNWYLFWMIRTSGKFTPAARTSTTTSSGPGCGSATSSIVRVSGNPYCLHNNAFIRLFLRFMNQAATRGRRKIFSIRLSVSYLGGHAAMSQQGIYAGLAPPKGPERFERCPAAPDRQNLSAEPVADLGQQP